MNTSKKYTTTFFFWFAWILSLTASAIFLSFEVREWIGETIKGQSLTSFLFIVLLLIAIAGSIISLFRKIPGGWLMLAGGVGLVLFYSLHGGIKDFGLMVVYGLPYIIPGIFFVLIRE